MEISCKRYYGLSKRIDRNVVNRLKDNRLETRRYGMGMVWFGVTWCTVYGGMVVCTG